MDVALFARSRHPMFLVDDERRYRRANEAAAGFLGYGVEELEGMRMDDITPDEERADMADRWQRFIADDHELGERRVRRKDGTVRLVSYARTAHALDDLHFAVYLGDEPDEEEAGVKRARPTPRELEVVRLLALGCNGEEIAGQLHLSPETVRTHVRNTMRRIGARTRAHLIALAVRDDLIRL